MHRVLSDQDLNVSPIFLQVIRPFLLRRKKAEVEKHLPSKVQVVLKSDLSAWQRSYYKQILESSSVAVEGGQSTGAFWLVCFLYMRIHLSFLVSVFHSFVRKA